MYITRIPSDITKYRRVKRMERICRGTLVKLLDTMVKRLASVLFPTDGVELYSIYCTKKSTEERIVKKMVNIHASFEEAKYSNEWSEHDCLRAFE